MILSSYPNIKFKIVIFILISLSFCTFSDDIDKIIFKDFDYSKYNLDINKDIIRLRLQNIAVIPGNTVFIGGVYETDILPLHPVLFISNDRGVSWQEIKLNVEGSGISNIKAVNKYFIYFIIERQEEGAYIPEYLVKFKNASKMDIYSLKDINIGDGIRNISFIEFYSDVFGLCNVIGTNGEEGSFFTKNGGRDWTKLWEVNDFKEYDYEYPSDVLNDSILKETYYNIFDSNGNKSTIQYRQVENSYFIEIYEYKKKNWEILSKIPMLYKLNSSGKLLESK
jgi:hypothetical protein